jgi:transcriptional regulator with XRE-family HTH domain
MTVDLRLVIGRNFARIRMERGLTQEQVAVVSGLSQQYISGLERGMRNPTIVTISTLAASLGVSYLDLLYASDGPEN